MPHVTIQMYPGRGDDLKSKVAREVAETVSRSLGIAKEHVSVSIEDIPQADWNNTVASHREDGGKVLFVDKGESVR